MKNELMEVMAKLDTQIDGVEAYIKRLGKIGESSQFTSSAKDRNSRVLGRMLRDIPIVSDVEIWQLRTHLQRLSEMIEHTFPEE